VRSMSLPYAVALARLRHDLASGGEPTIIG
jgi:hypothetical protein